MKATMFYDNHCPLCLTEALKMKARSPDYLDIVPVDDALEVLAAAGISRTDAMTYLCAHDADGVWHTHMDALRLLYRITGMPGLSRFLALPLVKQAGDVLYPVFARNRYRFPDWFIRMVFGEVCREGVCRIPPHKR